MAERKLSLVILGKATSALAAMKSTGDAAQGLGKRVTDMLPSFKTVALAGAAAFGAIGAAAVAAVQSASEDQLSQKKLADQLRRTTGATAEQIAAVEQYISKQMLLTGVTDDQLRPAMAALVRATGDVSFSQQQLGLALDISTATGKDLESVSLALGKAFTGNVGALTKLGIPLDESTKKSKNLTEIIKLLNDQFGGAATDAANTFSGRLQILRVSLGEAMEGIGYALLPIAERLVAFIQTHVLPVVQAFSDKLASGGGLRDALVAAAGTAGDFGLKVVNMVESIVKAFVTMSNIVIPLIKPLLLATRELAGGMTLILSGFDRQAAGEAEQVFTDIYNAISSINISTTDVSSAFDKFRTDMLSVGAASTVSMTAFEKFRNEMLAGAAATSLTQDQLRQLDQAMRQTASGSANVVPAFIGPLLAGYGATASATKTSTQLTQDFAATLAKLQAAAGGAGSKIATVGEQMKKYTSALVSARDATRAKNDATSAVTKAQQGLKDKTDAVTAAQAKFDLVVKGFPSTAKESIEATRKLADSQRSLRDAGLQVADAVRGVQDAEKKLADLRAQKADAEKVGGAERALERSKYGVEEAAFRVADAERALAEIRLDPEASAIEIRRAEIDLADAKLGVFDATQAVTDAERRLADERNATATPDEIAEAERNLERAKYAVTDALDAQTRATEEQATAQQQLNELTYGAVAGSVLYDSALKELNDAKAAQKDASETLTDALVREKDAVWQLAEATKALLDIQGKTKSGVVGRVQGGLGVTVGAGGAITEAIMDIGGMAGAGGGDVVTNFTLNVESGLTNPQETAGVVIDALGRYIRSNGFIPLDVGAFVGTL